METCAGALIALSLAGCYDDPEPFPYAIVSLAVLAIVVPFHRQAGYYTGLHISLALRKTTSFRVVDVDSTLRIFAEPSGEASTTF